MATNLQRSGAMTYTTEDIKRINDACELLKNAARLLYLVGSEDCVNAGAKIDEILQSNEGESGLLALFRKIRGGGR
jgi:hypothetical protein